MSLPHALLGLLDAGPMNGYSLARHFAGAQNWIWSAPQSQVYSALQKLARSGLIAGEERDGQNGLTTMVWSLTEQGRAEFRDWIRTPHRLPSNRDGLALQALFFDSVAPDEAVAVLRSYIAEQEQMIEGWRAHRDALAALETPLLQERLRHRDPAEHERIGRLKAHVFQGQISRAQAQVEWAEELIVLLQADGDAASAVRAS